MSEKNKSNELKERIKKIKKPNPLKKFVTASKKVLKNGEKAINIALDARKRLGNASRSFFGLNKKIEKRDENVKRSSSIERKAEEETNQISIDELPLENLLNTIENDKQPTGKIKIVEREKIENLQEKFNQVLEVLLGEEKLKLNIADERKKFQYAANNSEFNETEISYKFKSPTREKVDNAAQTEESSFNLIDFNEKIAIISKNAENNSVETQTDEVKDEKLNLRRENADQAKSSVEQSQNEKSNFIDRKNEINQVPNSEKIELKEEKINYVATEKQPRVEKNKIKKILKSIGFKITPLLKKLIARHENQKNEEKVHAKKLNSCNEPQSKYYFKKLIANKKLKNEIEAATNENAETKIKIIKFKEEEKLNEKSKQIMKEDINDEKEKKDKIVTAINSNKGRKIIDDEMRENATKIDVTHSTMKQMMNKYKKIKRNETDETNESMINNIKYGGDNTSGDNDEKLAESWSNQQYEVQITSLHGEKNKMNTADILQVNKIDIEATKRIYEENKIINETVSGKCMKKKLTEASNDETRNKIETKINKCGSKHKINASKVEKIFHRNKIINETGEYECNEKNNATVSEINMKEKTAVIFNELKIKIETKSSKCDSKKEFNSNKIMMRLLGGKKYQRIQKVKTVETLNQLHMVNGMVQYLMRLSTRWRNSENFNLKQEKYDQIKDEK